MKTVDEVLFFLTAYKKAENSGTLAGFEQRLISLFAEGQLSEESYKILRQIIKADVKPVVAPKIVPITTSTIDPCGTNVVTRGC